MHAGYVVLKKPRGVPLRPTLDNSEETVLSRLRTLFSGPKVKLIPVVHLDTDTSGLSIVALSRSFAGYFGKLMSTGKVHRTFRAVVQTHIHQFRS